MLCVLPNIQFNLQVKSEALSAEAATALSLLSGFQGNSLSRVRMSASKPNFEVGSSTQLKLSFVKKTGISPLDKHWSVDLDDGLSNTILAVSRPVSVS